MRGNTVLNFFLRKCVPEHQDIRPCAACVQLSPRHPGTKIPANTPTGTKGLPGYQMALMELISLDNRQKLQDTKICLPGCPNVCLGTRTGILVYLRVILFHFKAYQTGSGSRAGSYLRICININY